MSELWTRRGLIITAALVAGGCSTRRKSGNDSPPTTTTSVVAPSEPPSAPIVQVPPPEPEPKEIDLPAPPRPGGYIIVPRSAWTKNGVRSNNVSMDGVNRITVHHTGEHEGLVGLPDMEVVRRIENYHRSPKPSGKGWCAIGYHYIIGRDGRIFEGRPAQYQGAHTLTANEHNLGISVVGDFMRRLPNDAQLAALSKFLDDQRAKYRVGKNRVYGHRDLHSSLCPGEQLYGWLKRYKNQA